MTLTETMRQRLDNPLLSHEERTALKCEVAADLEHRGQYETACKVLSDLWQGVGQRPQVEGLSELTAAEVLLRVGTLTSRFGSAARSEELQATAKDLISESISRFQRLGQSIKAAAAQSDLALCFWREGAYDEAHKRIGLARRLFVDLKDGGGVARVDETRARVLLAEGRVKEAERAINSAVWVLEKGGENGTLAEALTTQGMVWARLGRVEESRERLKRAVEVGEQAGSLEEAGKALLTLLEEHAGWLSGRELWELYGRADELLGKTQDAEIVRRLRAASRRVMEVLAASVESEGGASWEGFSFYKDVLAYEARVIARALKDAQGSVSRASRLLGFRHHGSLVALLRARHNGLMPLRTPPAPRRRSVVRKAEGPPRRSERARSPGRIEKAGQPATILFVEDSESVADAVKGSLESLGWRVEICADGAEAWRRVRGRERYDLLIFDNDLPGMTGVELVRRARRLPHRRRTRVIVLSAGDAETEAWRAGADAFLRKPEDVAWLSATVARLLPGETEGTKEG